jgi:putative transposase
MILTFKYRIKDSSSRRKLEKLASEVNFVWNYINNLSFQNIKLHSRFLREFDINNYTSGASKVLNIHSTTIQELSKSYVNNRKTFKKRKLKWRSAKRDTLGWIPFKFFAIKLNEKENTITYCGETFKYYNSRNIQGKIKSGSFVQDSQGRWFICLACEVDDLFHTFQDEEVGIDLGLKDKVSLSNVKKFSRNSITKKYEKQLAVAQRAKKKKRIKKINTKIKNSRKDFNHKITTQIAKQFANVYMGDLKSTEILSEVSNINKSIYDSSLYQIKVLLDYKTRRFGGKYYLVDESYTTQTCNACLQRTGPKGKAGLKIREWKCSNCKSINDRDTNAAKNILLVGKACQLVAAMPVSDMKRLILGNPPA